MKIIHKGSTVDSGQGSVNFLFLILSLRERTKLTKLSNVGDDKNYNHISINLSALTIHSMLHGHST